MSTPQPAESSLDTEARAAEDFHPTPLGWLVAWLMDRRRKSTAPEEEPFEEHINGLA